jgi:hypothetical protein
MSQIFSMTRAVSAMSALGWEVTPIPSTNQRGVPPAPFSKSENGAGANEEGYGRLKAETRKTAIWARVTGWFGQ